jgi:hypothetical protein
MDTVITNQSGLKVNVVVSIDYKTAAILGITIFVAILAALTVSKLISK